VGVFFLQGFIIFQDNLSAQEYSTEEDVHVDSETCLDCHEEYDRSLAATPHRLNQEASLHSEIIGCASCHQGASEHIDDPDLGTISNPSKLLGQEIIEICTQCHSAHAELDNYGFDAHSIQELSCADCHKVHGYSASLLLDDNAEFCFRCHGSTRTHFAKNSNHPMLQQNITCLDCHNFTKRQYHDLAYGLNRTCQDCHPEQGGPFLYEHEAVNAYSLEGGGCTSCHDPHGSDNNRLLRQPGNGLCRQCHFPVGHTTAHGGIWAQYACQECHTDTHGSFISNLYLDPDLPAKFSGDCYNSGCHSLNR
jgi:DmsE family decaheme c-type cytochrome